MPSRELKPGWSRVKFGDVVRLNTERCANPAAAGIERYVGLEHIDPEDLRIRRWGQVSEGITFTNLFRPGQVLFGKRRAYQRKVAVPDFGGVCSSDIYVFESQDPQKLRPELLPFICQSEGFFEYAVGTSAGSLSPRTNWTRLTQYEFALPTPDEQERYAHLLNGIEKVLVALVAAKSKLRELRYSVEKAFFAPIQTRGFVQFKSLVEKGALTFQTGPFGTVLKASSYTQSGHPVISPSDMIDGEISLEKCRFVNDADWQRLEKYQMRLGDMVIGRKGDVQNLIYVTRDYAGFLIGSDCILFHIHDADIEPKYLFFFLRAEPTRQWLQGQAYGTTMPGINEKLLGRIFIPMPNPQVQLDCIESIEEIDRAGLLLDKKHSETKLLKLTYLQTM